MEKIQLRGTAMFTRKKGRQTVRNRGMMARVVWLGLLSGACLSGQRAGTIAGRVVGSGGVGVTNATVYLHSPVSPFRLQAKANAESLAAKTAPP